MPTKPCMWQAHKTTTIISSLTTASVLIIWCAAICNSKRRTFNSHDNPVLSLVLNDLMCSTTTRDPKTHRSVSTRGNYFHKYSTISLKRPSHWDNQSRYHNQCSDWWMANPSNGAGKTSHHLWVMRFKHLSSSIEGCLACDLSFCKSLLISSSGSVTSYIGARSALPAVPS